MTGSNDTGDTGDTDTRTAASRPTDQQSVAQTMDAESSHDGGAGGADDRPKPYPHDGVGDDSDSSDDASDDASDDSAGNEDDEPDLSQVPVDELPEPEKPDVPAYGEDEEQGYVDRDAIDFDPEDGLYSGTAVDGGDTEIPDPPSDDHVKAAFEDIKSGGDGLVDEQGNKVENRQDADDDD